MLYPGTKLKCVVATVSGPEGVSTVAMLDDALYLVHACVRDGRAHLPIALRGFQQLSVHTPSTVAQVPGQLHAVGEHVHFVVDSDQLLANQ